MENKTPILHDNNVDYSIITTGFFKVLDIDTGDGSRTYILKMMDGTRDVCRFQVTESQLKTVFGENSIGIGDSIAFRIDGDDNIPRCIVLQRKGQPVSMDTVDSIHVIEDALTGCDLPTDVSDRVQKALQVIKSCTGYSLLEYLIGRTPGERSLKGPSPTA